MDERSPQYGRTLIDAIDNALGKGGSSDPPFPKRPARARDVPDADPGPPVIGMTDEQLIRQGAQLRGHGLL